jgi:putative hydrolase of the HAD superfamily
MSRAIILDLDNTLYAVETIGEELFASILTIIKNDKKGFSEEEFSSIKMEIMRRPFQKVADKYGFSKETTEEGLQILRNLSVPDSIKPFDDYQKVKNFEADKFLVTTGFTTMQQSKVEKMGLKEDFKEIFIVDPEISQKTKKDVFAEIIAKYKYLPEEILVVGDDPESEIAAGKELGLETFLLDPNRLFQCNEATFTGEELTDVISLLESRKRT